MVVGDLEIDLDAIKRGDKGQFLAFIQTVYGTSGNQTADYAEGNLDTAKIDFPEQIISAIEAGEDYQNLIPQLDQAQLSYLNFCVALFERVLLTAQLDAKLVDLVGSLRTPFVLTLLKDPACWSDPAHDCRRFIDALGRFGVGWFSGLNKSGEAFEKALSTAVGTIHQLGLAGWGGAANDFLAFCEKEHERIARLEQRVCDSEAGMIRARQAELTIVQLFNETIGGRVLPLSAIQFLHGSWFNELRLYLIRSNNDQSHLKRWRKLLETLVWIFKPNHDESSKEKLYKLIPQLVPELENAILAIAPDYSGQGQVLETIERAQIELLKGAQPECENVPFLPEPDAIPGVTTVVSQSLIKRAQALKPGQWFVFKSEDGCQVRIKLALKMEDLNQLMFVNRNGQKTLQKGTEEFAFCLSTKIAKALSDQPLFGRAFNHLLQSLALQFEQKRKAFLVAKIEAEERARKLALERAEQEALRRREAQSKQIAADKARQEAETLARAQEDARLLAQAEQALEDEARQQQDRLSEEKRARLLVDSLNIGAWMTIPLESGDSVKAKLAVKISSTSKFIFVDGVGVKVAEYQRLDLIDLVREGQVALVEQGVHFEDRLAKVVRGLRKDT